MARPRVVRRSNTRTDLARLRERRRSLPGGKSVREPALRLRGRRAVALSDARASPRWRFTPAEPAVHCCAAAATSISRALAPALRKYSCDVRTPRLPTVAVLPQIRPRCTCSVGSMNSGFTLAHQRSHIRSNVHRRNFNRVQADWKHVTHSVHAAEMLCLIGTGRILLMCSQISIAQLQHNACNYNSHTRDTHTHQI